MPLEAPISFHARLGDRHAAEGNFELALQAYLEAIDENPHNSPAFVRAGDMCLHLGDFSAAVKYYLQAIQLAPRFLVAENNLAQAYLAMGDLASATKHFQRRLRLNPHTALDALVFLGVIARQSGDDRQAQTYFEQALSAWQPAVAAGLHLRGGGLINRAIDLMGLKRADEAIEALQSAIENLDPEDVIPSPTFELIKSATQALPGGKRIIPMLRRARNRVKPHGILTKKSAKRGMEAERGQGHSGKIAEEAPRPASFAVENVEQLLGALRQVCPGEWVVFRVTRESLSGQPTGGELLAHSSDQQIAAKACSRWITREPNATFAFFGVGHQQRRPRGSFILPPHLASSD